MSKLMLLRRPARGQAMIEFALVLALMLMLVITTINMLPAISARGVTLSASAAALDRVSGFLAPENGSAASNRQLACNAATLTARNVLRAGVGGFGGLGTLPVRGGDNGCQTNSAVGVNNPAVNVTFIAGGGGSAELTRGSTIQVCTSYTWTPTGGLFWLTMNGPFGLRDWTQSVFTFQYCGRDVIHLNRTR